MGPIDFKSMAQSLLQPVGSVVDFEKMRQKMLEGGSMPRGGGPSQGWRTQAEKYQDALINQQRGRVWDSFVSRNKDALNKEGRIDTDAIRGKYKAIGVELERMFKDGVPASHPTVKELLKNRKDIMNYLDTGSPVQPGSALDWQ